MGYRFFRYTKDDGNGNPIFYNRDGTQLAIMEKGTNLTTIRGGSVSGDDLALKANSVDARPTMVWYGNGPIIIDQAANQALLFNEVGTNYISWDYVGSTYITRNETGTAFTANWATKTTTGNIVWLDIDASTNLTMGTNLGATGLKINVATPNGAGHSQGIDLSSLAVDLPTFKVVSDAISTPGTLSGQIAILVGTTTYYIPYYTHGS